VQQLQAQQAELQKQYEELLRAQAEAQAARAEYVDLYDLAPVGYFSLGPAGRVEQLNLRAAQLLGTDRQRLAGRRFALFVAPADRPAFGQFLAGVLATDAPLGCELALLRADGTAFAGQLEGLRVAGPAGAAQCRLAVLDGSARRRAAEALAASEARFRRLFADGNDAVLLLQGEVFVDCNAAALRLLGAQAREQVVGQRPAALAPAAQPDGRPTAEVFRQRVEQTWHHGSQRCEVLLHRFTGEAIWVEAVLTALDGDGGHPPLVHMLWRDVTAERAVVRQLHHEKEFTQSLLENSVDGIVALDRTGRVLAWNSQAARYFGSTAAQALGQPVFAVLPALDTAAARRTVAQVLAGAPVVRTGLALGPGPGQYDAYHVPLRAHAAAAPSGLLVMFRDVTERNRLAEEAIRLRLRGQQELLTAILDTQETERKRIAESLHNGLGQLLYATKLSLGDRTGAVPRNPQVLALLEEAIRTTRTLSFELTPGILEDFGLPTALEALVKRLAPAGLPVRLHLAGLADRLPAAVELSVYRMVQELLNNAMRHAQAREVTVHVARDPGRLEVSVEDDGRGLDAAALAAQPLAGIGLAGVRNRVALLGGTLALNAQVGRGTIVSFELPL